MEKYGIIYIIRNKVNNKIYVGQTTNKKGFKGRYHCNLCKNTHNIHLKRSIEKYGIENFEIDEEFDVAYSEDELDKLEDMYIKIYDCIDNGYNDKTGGSNGKPSEEIKRKISEKAKGRRRSEEAKQKISEGHKGKHHSDETKQKIGEKHKGKIVSKESRQKMSENHANVNGENNPFYGKHHSEETKIKLGRKIICLTTGKIFNSLKEAGDYYNINSNNLSSCCRHKKESCGKLPDGTKLKWMYYDEYLQLKGVA